MKNIKTILLGTMIIVLTSGFSMHSSADLSANVAVTSEYYYRGILQNDSSASAGIDYESDGFFLGTWAADVDDGLEVDFYTGYGIKTESGLTLGIGFTGYYYTGEFDDTYEEVNLVAGFGPINIEYSIGEYANFDGPTQDYDFIAITFEYQDFYTTYGSFGDDFDGEYLELGYGTQIGSFDISIAGIFSSDELSDELNSDGNPTESEALVITLSKSFDL